MKIIVVYCLLFSSIFAIKGINHDEGELRYFDTIKEYEMDDGYLTNKELENICGSRKKS